MAFFPDTANLQFRFTDNVGRSIRTLEVQGQTYSTSTAVVTSATAPGPSGMFLSTPSSSQPMQCQGLSSVTVQQKRAVRLLI